MAIVEKTKREDTGAERFEIHLGATIYVLSLEAGEKIARDILSLMGIEVTQLEAVMEATNPWVPTMAIPNGYDCHYCRAFVRGFPARDWTKIHEEDCVFLKVLEARGEDE